MLGILFGVFCLWNFAFFTQASKSRCAVVIFVNQSTFNADEDFTEYLENIKGLSVNKTSVYFSEDPDTFKVNHGMFIDAPGLFALESEKFPGMFLRRANHSIVLEREHPSENYKNDATFLMDHSEKNESYTALKLFSHRSWKLFSHPDSTGPLLFDIPGNISQHRTGFNLLVIAQPCVHKDSIPRKVIASSKPKAIVNKDSKSVDTSLLRATSMMSDPTLNRQTDEKYVNAVTNKGKLNTISNEYSFEHFEVPDFIMHSLVEENKNAGDGMEAPKTDMKPSASIISNNDQQQQQQQIIEHQTKVPIAKQKISELTTVMDAKDVDDIEETLRDLQYGSKGCKLLVAEDTNEESGTSKDTVAHPQINKKACYDEFPSSCEEMAKKGYCLAFKSLMSTVCRKSCNLCARLVDTGFTSCTKSCGSGRQMRMIKINRREYLQSRRCNIQPCPIDGGYSEFGNFTECSVTCGKGVKYRRRTCTTPRPQFNGRSCRRLGPSIDSKECDEGLCSAFAKPRHRQHKNHNTKQKPKHETGTEHRKTNLHIDGPHSDGVHQHLILLKGKQLAKLRCTPRKGQLRNIIQDAVTKRFIVHESRKIYGTKKSDIEEGDVLDKKGDPVGESNPVVRAFKSPYKILLTRKGPHKTKLVEECVETDENEDEDGDGEDEPDESEDMTIPDDDHNFEKDEDLSDDSATKSEKKQHKNKNKQVYTRPEEKSFKDFDEYKYETGNVVTPQVTTFPFDDNHDSSYSALSGKLFDKTKGLDSILKKINAVSPRVDDQLSNEQGLESSSGPEIEKSVDGFTFNSEGLNQEGEADSASRAGFAVTTAPDSDPLKSRNSEDNDGYEVESVAEG